jgi:hypothetical protein
VPNRTCGIEKSVSLFLGKNYKDINTEPIGAGAHLCDLVDRIFSQYEKKGHSRDGDAGMRAAGGRGRQYSCHLLILEIRLPSLTLYQVATYPYTAFSLGHRLTWAGPYSMLLILLPVMNYQRFLFWHGDCVEVVVRKRRL